MPSANLTAHFFDTEAEAIAAIEAINAGEGFENEPGQLTATYTVYNLHTDGRFYITADAITAKYLEGTETVQIQL